VPANVCGRTASSILTDIATTLRLTAAAAACTTSAASATGTTRRHIPTARASTLTALIPTDVVIIILTHVTITTTMDSVIIEGNATIQVTVNVMVECIVVIVIAIFISKLTRSSAVAKRPRDALYH